MDNLDGVFFAEIIVVLRWNRKKGFFSWQFLPSLSLFYCFIVPLTNGCSIVNEFLWIGRKRHEAIENNILAQKSSSLEQANVTEQKNHAHKMSGKNIIYSVEERITERK